MSAIKFKKAIKHSQLGRMGCLNTYTAIYNLLPPDIINQLKSKQIGMMIDLLYQQKIYGENQLYKELAS